MSIKERLAKKTGDLVGINATATHAPTAAVQASTEERTPRTGPGQMLAYRSHMQENDKKVQDLKDQLKQFDDIIPVRSIDPQLISPSKWANRHESSFTSSEFLDLKNEIESCGGNVQPISVRPKVGEPGKFEIIFGHRRHQACLQLGLTVSAMVESIDDKTLFASMDRENRSRADLSPFEQGEMWRRALDEGLYPSLRKMAEELSVDPGNVSKAVVIARLPQEILAAFESPTKIQYRWGQLLNDALVKDPELILGRAKKIRLSVKKMAPVEVLGQLLGKQKAEKSVTITLKKKGKSVGKFVRKEDGSIGITLNAGVLNKDEFSQLKVAIEGLLGG